MPHDCFSTGQPGCTDGACAGQVCAVDPDCCCLAWDGDCVGLANKLCLGAKCPPSDHNCFTEGTPGCTDFDCCNAVCAIFPPCCEVFWDAGCVALASNFCGGCGDPENGDCCTEHLEPYCNDRACCDAVCFVIPDCCSLGWDIACVLEAMANPACPCDPTCPPSDHNCFTPGAPGCSDFDCCLAICNSDPYCCLVNWDAKCAEAAALACDGCGDPAAGDCCSEHPNPFCDNRTCCDLVCTALPQCCSVEWDSECVAWACRFPECDCECPPPTLKLIPSCVDSDPMAIGYQVKVEVWMCNISPGDPAYGYHIALDFDPGALNFNCAGSSYNVPGPFDLVITPMCDAESPGGKLSLDATLNLFGMPPQPPAFGNHLLATLCFDVKKDRFYVNCSHTFVDFDPDAEFPTVLSGLGEEILTEKLPADLLLDNEPPTIECEDIVVNAQLNVGDPCGAVIEEYLIKAFDDCGGPVVVDCDIPEGSVFTAGTTRVNCTATDECGNQSTCNFTVTVEPFHVLLVKVVLPGSGLAYLPACGGPAVTRCIRFERNCVLLGNQDLTLSAGMGGPEATATFLVPCAQNWLGNKICAKDLQHTMRATGTVVRADDHYELIPVGAMIVGPLTLKAGDNDNDGDVDINDVTFLIGTLGRTCIGFPVQFDPDCTPVIAPPTNRNADFTNNGAIQSNDYSLMTAQFLQTSACVCASEIEGPPEGFDDRMSLPVGELDADISDQADLNRDGFVDALDVRIFEMVNGLPTTLSDRMIDIVRERARQ